MTIHESERHYTSDQKYEQKNSASHIGPNSPSSEGGESPKQTESSIPQDQAQLPRKLPPPSFDLAQASNVAIPASKICLCQPDPKVPRPRNAFILYRQHHQAAVVARNPGLANPKISKIIGDHWRGSSDEVKEHWKSLAEEEKIRHQKQYPDYRYQPRRGTSKNNSESISPTTATKYRCPKCGGRNIPSSGLGTPTIYSNSHPNSMSQKSPQTPPDAGYRAGQLRSPPTPYSADYRRAPAYPGRHAYATTSDNVYLESKSPTSPDPKRRRVRYGPHSPTRAEPPPRAPLGPSRHQEMLPGSALMERRGTMAAPMQKPFHQRAQHIPTPLHLKQDTSERLPSLKTSNNFDNVAQTISVDAMVNSIQSVNKVKLLAKISPPLTTPGPTSLPFAIRGPIISIDGAEAEAVKKVTFYIKDFLTKDDEHKVQIWDGSPPVDKMASFPEYLRLIRDWHWKSQQIVHHITTLPSPRSPTPISPRTIPASKVTAPAESVLQSRSLETASPVKVDTLRTSPREGEIHINFRKDSLSSIFNPVPVALIPYFQLSQTDFFASRIPISDSYAPIDHWQWMATLWRGVVGPDITIVVKPLQTGEPQTVNSRSKGDLGISKDMLSNGSVTVEESSHPRHVAITPGVRKTGVELRLQDARTIVMRSIGEKDLRRVAFEVGEWVRDKVQGQGTSTVR